MTKEFAIAIIMLSAAIGPALAIGLIGFSGLRAIGRNPEVSSKVQGVMTLALAFAEALAIYGLVMSLILKFT